MIEKQQVPNPRRRRPTEGVPGETSPVNKMEMDCFQSISSSPRRTVIEQVLGGLGPYLGLEVVDSRPEGPFNVEVNVTGYKWGYCL